MKEHLRKCIAVAVFAVCAITGISHATLVTYPAPTGFPTNNTFSVQVREPGGTWKDLFVYNVRLVFNSVTNSSMVNFSFSNTIEMKVTLNSGSISSYEIRPASFGITPIQSGNTLTFNITQNDTFPRKFVLRVNNDWAALCLHVVGNPLEVNPPSQSEVTYYYAPGIYTEAQTAALRNLKSGDKVYIAGGAVVTSGIRGTNISNVWIGGRGILNAKSGSTGCVLGFTQCSNVTIDGITGIGEVKTWNVQFKESDHMTLSNFALFSGSFEWTDGIHFDGSQYCTATGCFVRTSDDCMLANGACYSGNENCENNTFKNSVVWGDKAQIFIVGFCGNVNANNVTKNILFQNIDVINHKEGNGEFRGVIKIWVTNNQTVRDVTFNDIRIMPFQDPSQALVVQIQLRTNYDYNVEGMAVRNITIRNLSYSGNGELQSLIYGQNSTRFIDTVTFINYTRNGTLVTSASNGNMAIQNFAYHVTFTGSQTPVAPIGQRSDLVKHEAASQIVQGSVVSVPSGDYSLRIVNGTGKIVRQERGTGPKTYNLSSAGQGGIYFVTVSSGSTMVSKMVMNVK